MIEVLWFDTQDEDGGPMWRLSQADDVVGPMVALILVNMGLQPVVLEVEPEMERLTSQLAFTVES